MRDDNGKHFIAKLYNGLLDTDLYDWLFSIIMLMNSTHTWILKKGFCVVFFSDNE